MILASSQARASICRPVGRPWIYPFGTESAGHWSMLPTKVKLLPRWVVYLHAADKYHRLTHRLSQGQKGLDERTLRASQRPFHPWRRPPSRPCGHTDPASAHGNPSLPLLLSLPHACAGCGHGGTRKSNTSRSIQTWSVSAAAIAGVWSCHCLAEPVPLVSSGCGKGWRKAVC